MRKNIIIASAAVCIAAFFFYRKHTQNASSSNQEKILQVEVNRPITTLDPATAEDLTSTIEISKVYEGLLEYHYLKRPATLIPSLAEAMPEVSRDGLVYTFKIKKGVLFQNNKCFPGKQGRELKAQDFVYSIKRVADPKTQSGMYSLIAGRIKGLDEWRERAIASGVADYEEPVEGLEPIDDYTLKFVLTGPWPQFLYILCMPYMYAVPREAVDFYGVEFLNNPVGTGPFMIENFNAQENKVVATKNPTFREKYYPTEASEECKGLLLSEAKRLPFVDRIITYVITENQTKWLKFQKRDLDILDLQGCSDVLKNIVNNEPNAELKEKGVKLLKRPFAHTSMYCFNCDHPILKNVNLRRAISMAYDRYQENILFNENLYEVAHSLIPPCLAGFDAEYRNKYVKPNIDEAKRLLAAAGYPNGEGLPVITLDVKQGSIEHMQAEYFQKCMEQIGVKIEVIVNAWSELLNKAKSKKVQIFEMNWFGDYPDAENFLDLFYEKAEGFGMYTNFSNKTFDDCYKKAMMAKSESDKERLYKQMNEIIGSELPMLPRVHNTKLIMYYDYVSNFDYLDSKYNVFEYIDIDLTKKKKV